MNLSENRELKNFYWKRPLQKCIELGGSYTEKNVFLLNLNPKTRPLPEEISSKSLPEYGIVEPKIIPSNRVTIRQALDMISKYQSDPKTYNSAHLAKEYKLELYDTQQILKYFQTFHMHIPKKMEERFPHLLDTLKERVSTLGSEKQKQLLNVAKDTVSKPKSKPTKSIEESS